MQRLARTARARWGPRGRRFARCTERECVTVRCRLIAGLAVRHSPPDDCKGAVLFGQETAKAAANDALGTCERTALGSARLTGACAAAAASRGPSRPGASGRSARGALVSDRCWAPRTRLHHRLLVHLLAQRILPDEPATRALGQPARFSETGAHRRSAEMKTWRTRGGAVLLCLVSSAPARRSQHRPATDPQPSRHQGRPPRLAPDLRKF